MKFVPQNMSELREELQSDLDRLYRHLDRPTLTSKARLGCLQKIRAIEKDMDSPFSWELVEKYFL